MPSLTSSVTRAGDGLDIWHEWIVNQKLKGPALKNTAPFYRNLETVLDERRAAYQMHTLVRFEDNVDFCSNDFLSLSTSGLLREAFLKELDSNPGFTVGSRASRLGGGDNAYIELVEKQIARFHGAETALLLNSGFDANCAIFTTIPRPGDAVVYDELIHASVHDGLKSSLATLQVPFKHNDAESLREVLISLSESNRDLREAKRCILVAVESVYSMDGDVSPLIEIVEVVKDVFPEGNAQIVVDEAHSTGMIGDNGRGLVCALKLENEIAIRLHTYGKGLGCTGGAILCNSTVRRMLVNFARPLIFTTAPSFPMLACVRAGYNMMETGETQALQDRVADLARLLCHTIMANPVWDEAVSAGVCSIPISEDLDNREFITQFLPVWTRPGYNFFLTMHLSRDGYSAIPIDPPIVPRGTSRVRVVIHAHNTEEQVAGLAASICQWAGEMLSLQSGPLTNQVPSATRQLYALAQKSEVHYLEPSKIALNSLE